MMAGEEILVSRRSLLKRTAVAGAGLTTWVGAGTASTTPGWTGITATYRIVATGDSKKRRVEKYTVEVVGKRRNDLIVEVVSGGHTSRFAIPVDVAVQPIRGETSRVGGTERFVRNADAPAVSTIRGSVSSGWIDSLHSVREVEGRTLLELDVELLDHDSAHGRSNRGIVLLPQIIPPDSRTALGTVTASQATDVVETGMTTQDVTQYGYSTLITKDNQPANLTTSKTELQCWGEWDGDTYTSMGGDVDVSTAINWSKTGKTERENASSNSYSIDIDFYGNFPAGAYTDWKNRHQHTHFFEDGDHHDPNLFGRLERRIPSQSWELHKTNHWNEENYDFGDRLTGQWYII